MKFIFTFLILVSINLISCNKQSDSTETEVKADQPVIAPPIIQDVEIYIIQHTLGPNNGAIMTPNLAAWRPNMQVVYRSSTSKGDGPLYAASIEYLGQRDTKDIYEFSYSLSEDGKMESYTQTIEFKGDQIEIFKDD